MSKCVAGGGSSTIAQIKNTPRGVFLCERLRASDVDGARTLVRLLDLEGHRIANLELVVGHAHERRGVEEGVLLLSFDGDKAEALVGHRFDGTGHSLLFVNNLQIPLADGNSTDLHWQHVFARA